MFSGVGRAGSEDPFVLFRVVRKRIPAPIQSGKFPPLVSISFLSLMPFLPFFLSCVSPSFLPSSPPWYPSFRDVDIFSSLISFLLSPLPPSYILSFFCSFLDIADGPHKNNQPMHKEGQGIEGRKGRERRKRKKEERGR
jgi:hypothetical protein